MGAVQHQHHWARMKGKATAALHICCAACCYAGISALVVRSNSGQRLHIPGCAAQINMQDISNTGMYTAQLHHTLHVYLSLAACCTVIQPDMRCPGGPLTVDVTTYSVQHAT